MLKKRLRQRNDDKLLKANGREPLLPRLTPTPHAQMRRGVSVPGVGSASHRRNQVTTALLSANSDYDDDEDDDDEGEDFDLYDDENIVVTTTICNEPSNRLTRQGLTEESPTKTTTTTIRLTQQ
ncbi:hypothetical protein EVAR_72094_1 [Eumeta japonica]|uniref:Uncharacterized protein n=1 Tax=Eumeta variegata TaxID=151549 RepID=A0A4C1SHN9_EUMVA|nr:hypothetical protein EVAR_72094_1 [Eumeta japonica]